MKKLNTLFIIAVLTVVVVSCKPQDASSKIDTTKLENAKQRDLESKKDAASISFDKTAYDFGTVPEGTLVETTFKVTNTGKTDLVISNAQPSCGCTVPAWPKEPIKPGETGDVLVKFDTSGKPNKQTKSVTLYTNTAVGREVLTISGSVTPKAN